MALPLRSDSQSQFINFFGQFFFALRALFLRGFERGQLGLLFCELIAYSLKFAL